jgi:hypothetical protein
MKTIVLLSVLLLTGSDARDTFWQQFKTAVAGKNIDAIATLSRFPIGMSYGIPTIRSKVDLRKRYRRVFNEQTDAAACFSKAKMETDPDNAKNFTVACPDAAGNEVVVYHFNQTRAGWKFTGMDNLNE